MAVVEKLWTGPETTWSRPATPLALIVLGLGAAAVVVAARRSWRTVASLTRRVAGAVVRGGVGAGTQGGDGAGRHAGPLVDILLAGVGEVRLLL